MNARQSIKGFTIIEVVLVLAIAGLIIMMVFIALPALQAGQRDTARKNDVAAIVTAVSNYTSNNRGGFPTTTALTGDSDGKPGGYAKSVSSSTTKITVGTASSTSAAVTEGAIVVVQKTTCGATGASTDGTATQTLSKGTSSQFTVSTYLEAGGGTSFCQDS